MDKEQTLVTVFETVKEGFYIGKVLKVARESKGVTEKELADLLSNYFGWQGVDTALVARVEMGEIQVSLDQLKRICGALGYEIGSFMKIVTAFKEDSETKSEQEVYQEVIDDMDYHSWRFQQKKKE